MSNQSKRACPEYVEGFTLIELLMVRAIGHRFKPHVTQKYYFASPCCIEKEILLDIDSYGNDAG